MEDEIKICGECENEPATRYCKSCEEWVCDDCVRDHYVLKHMNKRYRKEQQASS